MLKQLFALKNISMQTSITIARSTSGSRCSTSQRIKRLFALKNTTENYLVVMNDHRRRLCAASSKQSKTKEKSDGYFCSSSLNSSSSSTTTTTTTMSEESQRASLSESYSSTDLKDCLEREKIMALPENALILGIETSCDDTGCAIVTKSGKVISQSLKSQVSIHEKWGGVVPTLAQEAHKNAIDDCVKEALDLARCKIEDLSAVAVTVGPGLAMCLRVGVRKAQKISAMAGIPIVPVHHMEAHCLVARVKDDEKENEGGSARAEEVAKFPFVALLVSGGHNVLLKVEGVGKYTILGQTLDDAIGEAYDKTARILGLPVGGGGGPALEALAKEYEIDVLEKLREKARAEIERDDDVTDEIFEKIVQKKVKNPIKFTVPLKQRKTCDFSFAGLKTNVRMAIEKNLGTIDEQTKQFVLPSEDWDGIENREMRASIAHAFQDAAVKHLEDRVDRAIRWVKDDGLEPTCLVVAGGVAANQKIRKSLSRIAESHSIITVFPKPAWCTDNGVMVAWAGVERLNLGLCEKPVSKSSDAWIKSEHDRDCDVHLKPRWPLGDLDVRATSDVRSMKVAKISLPLSN